MLKKTVLLSRTFAAVSLVLLAGCTESGKVDQGRVVAFDKEQRLATIIRYAKGDMLKPEYARLPAVIYALPDDPQAMGPLPKVGSRLALDEKKNQIVLFDAAAQRFTTVVFAPIAKQTGIARDNALVKDKPFPLVDRQRGTITLYLGKEKTLFTFSVPAPFLSLPDSAWEAGDEVRVYYKNPGRALRFMNVTQTDIYKK